MFPELCLRSVSSCTEWSCLSSLSRLRRLDLYRTCISTSAAVAVVWANPALQHLNVGRGIGALNYRLNLRNMKKNNVFIIYNKDLLIVIYASVVLKVLKHERGSLTHIFTPSLISLTTTHWLTHWLTNSLNVSLTKVYLACFIKKQESWVFYMKRSPCHAMKPFRVYKSYLYSKITDVTVHQRKFISVLIFSV